MRCERKSIKTIKRFSSCDILMQEPNLTHFDHEV